MPVLIAIVLAAMTPHPGAYCMTLAHRQALAGSPDVHFRVLKQTYAPNFVTSMHKHKLGEIIYLLSGSGSLLEEKGKKTTLSPNSALVIPAEAYHRVLPGPQGVTVLTVQFTKKHSPTWEPKTSKTSLCRD